MVSVLSVVSGWTLNGKVVMSRVDVNKIIVGNALDVLHDIPDGIFQTCVTSPPY